MRGHAPTIAWIVLAILLLISFLLDVDNTTQGGAIDLRNRITGIRLLENQIDPYHYKWQEPEPAEYCDPYNNPRLPVSKTTATPALLLTHLPLAELPYRFAQFAWFLIQWLLLLGTAWLWLKQCSTERQRLWISALVVGFTYTAAWRLHAERGQSYVLLLFLFATWIVTTRDEHKGFLSGLIAGFLIALRPPFLLLAPFMALHRRGQFIGLAVGLFLGILLPLLINSSSWTNYATAMNDHSRLYRGEIEPPPGPQRFPATIEGVPTDTLANYVAIPYADFSVHAFLREFEIISFPAWPLLLVAVIPFGIWLWFSRQWKEPTLLQGLVAWLFLIDLFLPAYRDSYNDVLILNLLALGVIGGTRLPWFCWLGLVALPLGWIIYTFAPTEAWVINLPTFIFTLSALLALFPFDADKPAQQARAS